MARAVYVRIVPRFRFILYVRCVDRDPTLFFFRRFVNLVILRRFRLPLLRQYHRDRRRQRRLPMVYVTNRSDIYMRFRTFKFSLRHRYIPPYGFFVCFRVGAGDGNRTHVAGLGSRCSTIELHPHACVPFTTRAHILMHWRAFVNAFGTIIENLPIYF